MVDLKKLKELYETNKHKAFCIDVEGYRGSLTVIGFFQPKDGPVTGYISLVKGSDLTAENIKAILKNCKLLITFNGIPNVPHLDLWLVAKALNKGFGLKTLEKNYGIYRRDEVDDKHHVAHKWWRKYERTKDKRVLDLLIAYNREDTINLYMLAECLMKEIK